MLTEAQFKKLMWRWVRSKTVLIGGLVVTIGLGNIAGVFFAGKAWVTAAAQQQAKEEVAKLKQTADDPYQIALTRAKTQMDRLDSRLSEALIKFGSYQQQSSNAEDELKSVNDEIRDVKDRLKTLNAVKELQELAAKIDLPQLTTNVTKLKALLDTMADEKVNPVLELKTRLDEISPVGSKTISCKKLNVIGDGEKPAIVLSTTTNGGHLAVNDKTGTTHFVVAGTDNSSLFVVDLLDATFRTWNKSRELCSTLGVDKDGVSNFVMRDPNKNAIVMLGASSERLGGGIWMYDAQGTISAALSTTKAGGQMRINKAGTLGIIGKTLDP